MKGNNIFRPIVFRLLIGLMAISPLMAVTARAGQNITFSTVDGGTVALSSLQGKVVVLLFAGIQDPQCRDEFKALQALSDRYRGRDVRVYWVSINPVGSVSNDRLKSPCGSSGAVTVLRDPSQAAFKQFSGATAQLPTLVVLDQEGKVVGQPRGGFNPDTDFVNDLASSIDGLLSRRK